MKTLKDFNVKGKRVLVRCDFNVPLGKQGDMAKKTSPSSLSSSPSEMKILDDFRIRQSLPTIQYLIGKEAKVILMSHLGRPDGKVVEKLRLTLVQNKLMEYLDVSITKAPDCISPEIKKWTLEMQPGEILLLENIQFCPGEKKNDQYFAKALAGYGDIFIMEAFGQAHRNYASIISVPKYLPAGIGFLFEKEIEAMNKIIEKPDRPLIAIIAGAKVKTKIKLVKKILTIADFILVNNLIAKGINNHEKILKPIDDFEELDIGPKTRELFSEKIASAKTIFWNGPLGQIEKKEFSRGTEAIAKAVAQSKGFSVVGGGETIEFINKLGLSDNFNHISTGGGAMLDFISNGKLVGLDALK